MGRETVTYSDGDFVYDYDLIRRGGLIFAAVLFFLGIAIIFCKRLSCGSKTSEKLTDTATNAL